VAPTRTVGISASIIFPCSIKSRRQEVGKPSLNAAQPYAKAESRVFLLVPAYPGHPGTKAVVVVKYFFIPFSPKNGIIAEFFAGLTIFHSKKPRHTKVHQKTSIICETTLLESVGIERTSQSTQSNGRAPAEFHYAGRRSR